ncbi:hypothetical protein [Sphingomonas sp. C3-2]|uniref:hypothetical protein n=1 Tax=Sphingomonas sp. C3-2 TaxID=3062169 RepID=UPI00294AC768|nr:hypothetical protein [Sphingomonas sp. C3-2]WOK38081.1 hypothetical protein QYC26_07855 [Sphingomonas sp. C3-2]
MMFRWILRGCAALALWLPVQMASAQVVVTFYSHDLDDHFPHAFFTLEGTPEAGGVPVDTNYGFTAKTITPAILFGSVAGRIDIAKPGYVAHSKPHFSMTLTDAQYAAILGVVDKWRDAPSPSYNMNTANCVFFVGEAAQAIGLDVAFPKKLMKKPRSYLEQLHQLNPQVTDMRMVGRQKDKRDDDAKPAETAVAAN